MRRRLIGVLVGVAFLSMGMALSQRSFQWFPSGSSTRSDTRRHSLGPTTAFAASSTMRTQAFVTRAVDGDTLVVRIDGNEGEKYVRLLGINTPETVDPRRIVECFGKEASAYMRALVEGKRITLAADLEADERDKYDRLLRNVFLADGTDVNLAMVREGYAYAYLSFPLHAARKRELRKSQEEAKRAQRGLWNPNTCNGQR
ncbi:MAG: thermonuclease family protein [Patescibacteria group bacterium]